jgi:hypothetical protein
MEEQEGKNTLLALEMTVNGPFRDTDLTGDPPDSEVFTARFEYQFRRSLDYLLLP